MYSFIHCRHCVTGARWGQWNIHRRSRRLSAGSRFSFSSSGPVCSFSTAQRHIYNSVRRFHPKWLTMNSDSDTCHQWAVRGRLAQGHLSIEHRTSPQPHFLFTFYVVFFKPPMFSLPQLCQMLPKANRLLCHFSLHKSRSVKKGAIISGLYCELYFVITFLFLFKY